MATRGTWASYLGPCVHICTTQQQHLHHRLTALEGSKVQRPVASLLHVHHTRDTTIAQQLHDITPDKEL